MPKVTVYLPNDLWDRLKDRPGGSTVSQFVQRALEGQLGTIRPGTSNPRAVAVAARMKEEARAIYRAGFDAGLQLSDQLSWSQLDRLEEQGWDVDAWIEADPGFETTTLRELVAQWLAGQGPGGANEDIDVDFHLAASQFETESYKAGWIDALKEVWSEVMRELRTTQESRSAQ